MTNETKMTKNEIKPSSEEIAYGGYKKFRLVAVNSENNTHRVLDTFFGDAQEATEWGIENTRSIYNKKICDRLLVIDEKNNIIY